MERFQGHVSLFCGASVLRSKFHQPIGIQVATLESEKLFPISRKNLHGYQRAPSWIRGPVTCAEFPCTAQGIDLAVR